MTVAFWIAAAVAVAATGLAITRRHPVHALLLLIVSLLSVAVVFLTLGAHLAAALEVIIYAGAILVLFVFVVFLLSLEGVMEREAGWLTPRTFVLPLLLALILVAEVVWLLAATPTATAATAVGPRQVGELLFGPWVVAVELASLLLLAGLVGAFHLGPQRRRGEEER